MPTAASRSNPAAGVRAGLLVLIITMTAGCGSVTSSSTSSITPGVGQAFATKALAVCQHARDLKVAQGPFPVTNFNPTKPDSTKLAEVVVFLHLTDATFNTWLTEMQALGTPPSGAAAWADLVAAVESHRDINADQIAAAERGDTTTFTADYHAGLATQARLLAAAIAAGVADCAKVDR